ncbi:MAG: hypothetical protein ACOY93_11650 [Bacillota bacterium]
MKQRGVSVFTVAATYVGTVVGAGFATGQEILKFFTHFGLSSIYGVLVAAVLLAVLGSVVLRLGHRLQAESHLPVVEAAAGPTLGRVVDWVITFFLFGGAAIMMAGSGAVFAEHWHLNRFMGTLVMAILSGGTVVLGLRGVVASISAVAPILIGMVLVVSTGSILVNGISAGDLAWFRPAQAATNFWPVSALLYVSYNLLLSVAVLGPLGREVKDERVLHYGGLLGGLALGLGALFINLAVLAGLPDSAGYEVPMLHLARQFPGWLQTTYSLVLWAEVYTTAVASLFGLAVRLSQPESPRYIPLVVGASALALVAAQFGFSNLVGFLFPAVGWVGLILIGGLFVKMLRMRTPV